MKFEIPELSLVVLMGASGAGKSSFARKHFKSTEILSSDFCRGLVSDDENNQHLGIQQLLHCSSAGLAWVSNWEAL